MDKLRQPVLGTIIDLVVGDLTATEMVNRRFPMSDDHAWLTVTLREWLENQRGQQTPHQAVLRAAIDSHDTATVRSLLAEAPFNADQRKYLDDLLNRWEKALPD